MILRGVDFGRVWGASGVQGFFGEGYRFHKLFGPLGPNFEGLTFVAKTTTLEPRLGNLPLDDHYQPHEWWPRCIKVKFFRGAVLNAVGLSGPGARALFFAGCWQTRQEPFCLSFMAVSDGLEHRLDELRQFLLLLRSFLPTFKGPLPALQINLSCPNVGHRSTSLLLEAEESLDLVKSFDLPVAILIKLNLLASVSVASAIAKHPTCDGLVVTNSLPWNAYPNRINWVKLFGSATSPLADLGGGGLSGAPLLELVCDWLIGAREEAKITKPICAGGGILTLGDARLLLALGADAVSLGSIAILRPWRVRKIIRVINTP